MKTKLTPEALFKAESMYNAEYIDYDMDSTCLVNHETPEDIAIKNDNFLSLSTEAKEVINTVLNTPTDIFSMITTKHGNISKTQVKAYFKAKFGKVKVSLVFNELAEYVNSF